MVAVLIMIALVLSVLLCSEKEHRGENARNVDYYLLFGLTSLDQR